MKKRVNFGVAFTVVFITVFALLLGFLIYVLSTSNKLREFKVDLFVLCNEADICTCNSEEGLIRVGAENLAALNSIIYSTKGYFTLGSPEVTEEINLDFVHDSDNWKLTIGKAGENRLMVNLEGPRNYKVYIKENKKFDEIKRCVSKDGYNTANKVLGNK